ncbi:unnamed protein product, partial [Allacma fusca]
DQGKTYYHNVNTKESRWTVPPELEEIRAKIVSEAQAAMTPQPVPVTTTTSIISTQIPNSVPMAV